MIDDAACDQPPIFFHQPSHALSCLFVCVYPSAKWTSTWGRLTYAWLSIDRHTIDFSLSSQNCGRLLISSTTVAFKVSLAARRKPLSFL